MKIDASHFYTLKSFIRVKSKKFSKLKLILVEITIRVHWTLKFSSDIIDLIFPVLKQAAIVFTLVIILKLFPIVQKMCKTIGN